MNIAIVDDSAADRPLLEQMIRQYGAVNNLSFQFAHFSDGEALLREYEPFGYTVIFLDIFMQGLSGIDTARRLRAVDEETPIVFLTASEAHRPEAVSVFASGYLSKPASEAEVFRVLDHILRIRTRAEKRFDFSYDRRSYSLRLADIVSIETDGNYLVIRDRQGGRYRTRMTFSRARMEVDARFLTLMKGIMVNMDCVTQIQNTVCTLQGGSTFPIRVKEEGELRQKWLNYKFAAIRRTTETSEVKNGC
jgi:DNA-binding LytR/AlgR family response regulator